MEDFKRNVNALDTQELADLRDYVTSRDEGRYDGMAEGLLRLDCSHSNLKQRWHDLKFNQGNCIQVVKEKLHFHGGTAISHMELFLRRGSDTIFMGDDNKTLAYYGARSGMEICIKDTDPYSLSKNGGLEDVSQVEKYVMADEDYDKRENTVRTQMRRKAEAKALEMREAKEAAGLGPLTADDLLEPKFNFEEALEKAVAAFPIESRCLVEPGSRRGTVLHVGPVTALKGVWIGICLDEPQGSNDGTKDGKKYFDAPGPRYGVFAKPENVTVGDYPPLDPFASDDEF